MISALGIILLRVGSFLLGQKLHYKFFILYFPPPCKTRAIEAMI